MAEVYCPACGFGFEDDDLLDVDEVEKLGLQLEMRAQLRVLVDNFDRTGADALLWVFSRDDIRTLRRLIDA